LSGEKTASIAAGAQKFVFMKLINGAKAILARWLTPIQWFAETVFDAFRNALAELWKNLWIRIF
jgi:predicted phage tail protein